MRSMTTVVALALLLGVAAQTAAQATGTPSYNAPYRAFTRSEFGAILSFPSGGGTALEGALRLASGKFDVGFKVGFFDPGGLGQTSVLLGAEARQRVLTHSVDFPLDGAAVVGVGANLVSGANTVLIPVGLSLGRRIDPQGSKISIVPYVQPTLFIVSSDLPVDNVQFALGLGADFRIAPRLDARFSAGLGDVEGVSLGLVWLH